jgi:helicase
LKIANLPIPECLSKLLESLGYVELYPPQEEAITQGALSSENLLLTTPTASGKTLVALMVAAKIILENGGKVVYLTPLRALANEKYEEFKILESLEKSNRSRIKVHISTGDYDSQAESLGSGDIIVLTNEKFDSIIRHGVTWLDRVQLYVADEVHLIGSQHRGPALETILTKIRSFSQNSQILALSATITNAKDLAQWLGAKLVDTNWRPVSLVEGIYTHGEIRFSEGPTTSVRNTGRGPPIDVAAGILGEGGQSLIFTETRRRAVSLAVKASEITPSFMSKNELKQANVIAEEIMSTGEETELSRTLSRMISKGSAFHHAGLDSRHRRLVEDHFRGGLIKILTATPTLAAGVNLPARRVVISSLVRYDSEYGGQAPISVLDYKQMCGRAGRPKFDTVGETVLIASSSADYEEILYTYIKGRPEPILSQLSHEGALRTHLLATIATLPGITEAEIAKFFSKTLLATQYRPTTVQAKTDSALNYLISENLVESRGKRLIASEFGKRISLLYIDPATGVLFKKALNTVEQKRRYLVGLMHLIVASPDFTPKFYLRRRDWTEAETFLETFRDEFIIPTPKGNFDLYDSYMADFRSLLVMNAWINEWSEDRLLETYGVEPGDLHRAVENSDWLLHSLHELAKLFGKGDILTQIDELKHRTRYGVKTELIMLTRLEGIGRVRARALYNAGLTDVRSLASTSVSKLASIPKIGAVVARKIKEQVSH